MFDLPSFSLLWDFSTEFDGFHVINDDGFNKQTSSAFCFSQNGFEDIIAQNISSDSSRHVLVLGSAIVNDSVDNAEAAKNLCEAENFLSVVQEFNGEFLVFIYESTNKCLHIFTDRFGSYPLYYTYNGQEFCVSTLYLNIARYCKGWNGFALRPEKAYEFFVLQRLMGEETHDTLTKILPPAAHLRIDNSGLSSSKYWERSYKKDYISNRHALENRFIELFSKSVHRRLNSNNKEFGVFLSGGHDSRLVAAYADRPVTCYTLGFIENRESNCAKLIAHASGQKHKFLRLDDDYFFKTLDAATYLSGGMYALDHALFLPVANTELPQANVYLHGHGLDFMFQGMYLHAKPYKLFGRDTFLRKIISFPSELASHFINTVSFRLKFDLNDFLVSENKISYYKNSLHNSVQDIVMRAKKLNCDVDSIWEYLIFHHHARHYTYTNVLSKRACGEVRTPSFDNDLYDFYLSLPNKYRLHADILRAAMNRHPKKIGNIPAGNHAIPAGYGPYKKTLMLLIRKVLKEVTGLTMFGAPSAIDRTWPDRDEYFKTHAAYREAAFSALSDEKFMDFLDFIDWEKVKSSPEAILNTKHGGAFFVTLLTYYKFYQFLYKA